MNIEFSLIKIMHQRNKLAQCR